MTPLVVEPSQSGAIARKPSEPPPPKAAREPDTRASAVQRAFVEREESREDRRRLLRALMVGLIAWNAYALVDLTRAVMTWPDSDPLAVLALRIAPTMVVLVIWRWLRARPDASARAIRAIELFAFSLGSALTGVFAVLEGGLLSFHIAGLVLVMFGHAIMLGSSWRRAVAPVLCMLAIQPIVIAIGAFFEPEVAAQWRDSRQIITYFLSYTLALGAGGLTLFGGHSVWSLRKQVAESRSIGRYRLRKRIASGGMGEIWSACHAALKRDVAVKLIQPRLGQDEKAIERFEREVRALAELSHPYIVRVFDYGATEDGIWYYAMELLSGDDLKAIVTRDGPLVPLRAVRLVRQAAEALAEAHARGIVHRDVKPANLLLVESAGMREFVKLLDFGVAKLGRDELELTATGMVVGTPGYIAPEVIRGEEATPASDIYALGAVLYYLVAGKAPLEGETPEALALAHLGTQPPRPSTRLGRPLPEELERIVMRCLQKDPHSRYRDTGSLVVALRSLEEDLLEATRSVF